MSIKKIYLLLLTITLVIPNLAWVCLDKSLWPWDLSFYATESIHMWRLLTLNPSEYLHNLFTMMNFRAPLFCWVGEFFSPLGNYFGYEKAFLFMQILTSFLIIIEITRWEIFSKSSLKITVAALMVASTPVFIALSHFYFVEVLQTYGVLLVWGLYLKRKKIDVVHITCAYIALFFFLLGVKVTSPFYILFPSLALLYECWLRRSEYSWQLLKKWPTNGWCVFGLLVVSTVTIWYLHNWLTVYAFAKLVSSGPISLIYGVKATLLTKLSYWFSNTKSLFWGGRSALVFEILIIVGLLLNWHKILCSSFFLAFAQIALVLFMMSFQTNQETRYLYPLLPYFLFIFGKIIIQNRLFILLFICLFLFRWVEINLGTLGIWPLQKPFEWSQQVDRQGKSLANAVFILKKIDEDGGKNKNIILTTDQITMNAEGYQFKYFTQYPDSIRNDHVYRIGLWYTKPTIQQALKDIQKCHAGYVITLPSAALKKIHDNLTKVTLPLTSKLRSEGWTTFLKNNNYLVLKKPAGNHERSSH